MDKKLREAFDQVRAEDALKEKTLSFLKAAIDEEEKQRQPRPLQKCKKSGTFVFRLPAFASVAAVCAIFFVWLYAVPVSAISVDINPSIELNVNRLDRVVSVEALNPDGEKVLSEVKLLNLHYESAVETLLNSASMQPYLSDESFISVTVAGKTERKSLEMQSAITSGSYAKRANFHCQIGKKEDVSAAHALGLSFGKYRMYLKLRELDPTITPQEAGNLSMRQMVDAIQDLGGSLPDSGGGAMYRHRQQTDAPFPPGEGKKRRQ
ncbi:MAG: anti-sigma-I factor RsgI family protein [Christensenellales bacterium]|jgi:hypothetical protein|nr:hypothetical protein [Clostridiales bacterium]